MVWFFYDFLWLIKNHPPVWAVLLSFPSLEQSWIFPISLVFPWLLLWTIVLFWRDECRTCFVWLDLQLWCLYVRMLIMLIFISCSQFHTKHTPANTNVTNLWLSSWWSSETYLSKTRLKHRPGINVLIGWICTSWFTFSANIQCRGPGSGLMQETGNRDLVILTKYFNY